MRSKLFLETLSNESLKFSMFKNWTKFQKKKKSFLDVQINFPTFKIKEVGFFSFKGGETFFGAREEDNSSCLALHHNPAKFSD